MEMYKYQLPDIQDIELLFDDVANQRNVSMIHILEAAKDAKTCDDISKNLISLQESTARDLYDNISISLSDLIEAGRDTRDIDQLFKNIIESDDKLSSRLIQHQCTSERLVNFIDNDKSSIKKKLYSMSSIQRPSNILSLGHMMFINYEIYRTHNIPRSIEYITSGAGRRGHWFRRDHKYFDELTWTDRYKLMYALDQLIWWDSKRYPFLSLLQKRFPKEVEKVCLDQFKLMSKIEKNQYLFKFLLRAPSEESMKIYNDRIESMYDILDTSDGRDEDYTYIRTLTDRRNILIYTHPEWSDKFLRDTVLTYHLANILHLQDHLIEDLEMKTIDAHKIISDLLVDMVRPYNEDSIIS